MKPTQIKETAELIGWTPFELAAQPYMQGVKWADLGDARFDEPFFGRTIARHLAAPDTRVTVTGLDTLQELAAVAPHLAPSGFIFHMSRVGSTLLANALKADARNLVIAEPTPINQLLRSPFRHAAAAQWRGWLVALVAALGQPRHAAQTRYFVKFTSHNILRIDLIREAFPEVPWLFLYRDPVEVMVSNLARPPGWHQLYDDPQAAQNVFGIAPEQLRGMSREQFYAEVLRSFCEAALTAASAGALVNYTQVTPDSIGAIAAHFGLAAGDQDLESMRAVFQRDAKGRDGGRGFRADAGAKQRDAAAAIVELSQEFLAEPYRKMEQLRLAL